MAFDFGPLRSTAQALITEFGRSCTLRRREASEIDSDAPWLGSAPDTVNVQTAPVCFVEFTIEQRGALSNVQQKDKQALVAAADLTEEIDVGWEIVDGADIWQVVAILDKIQPGTTLLAYSLQVRL